MLDQIQSMWASGIITADALYWNETSSDWEPVHRLLKPIRNAQIRGYRDGCKYTSPVGSFKENRYGHYDLGGNIHEYCQDSTETDLRGPGWDTADEEASLVSTRFPESSATTRSNTHGFRIVLVPGPISPDDRTHQIPVDEPFANSETWQKAAVAAYPLWRTLGRK